LPGHRLVLHRAHLPRALDQDWTVRSGKVKKTKDIPSIYPSTGQTLGIVFPIPLSSIPRTALLPHLRRCDLPRPRRGFRGGSTSVAGWLLGAVVGERRRRGLARSMHPEVCSSWWKGLPSEAQIDASEGDAGCLLGGPSPRVDSFKARLPSRGGLWRSICCEDLRFLTHPRLVCWVETIAGGEDRRYCVHKLVSSSRSSISLALC
jgi:hypothetical protein